ncbi:MAG: hydroxymethylpyrimidine/phosphomethylpyrimidine kinase [Verrucomicrobiales bacterium]|jgi:hydroxymethylpyrimidine/phosphomethylpyrimidine kinase
MPSSPPIALSIAGSDCSAGAGIQADLKSFSAHGVFGLTAITCVVAEVPGKVGSIVAIPPAVLAEQLTLLGDSFPIGAIKTGMLYSSEHVRVVIAWLNGLANRPPLVIDPVMIATSGDSLLKDDALEVYTKELLPMAALITPNLDEAKALAGAEITSHSELEEVAKALASTFNTNVLAKGGHLGGTTAIDILATPDGQSESLGAPFVADVSTHGTGCTYSAAIAARLASGDELKEAVTAAKRFVTAAISDYFRWQDIDALNHFQQD